MTSGPTKARRQPAGAVPGRRRVGRRRTREARGDHGRQRIRLQIPSAPRYLGLVRLVLDEIGGARGVSETILQAVKSAVNEACANAIKHAYRFEEDHEILLAVEASAGEMTVTVEYEDAHFDPAAIPPPRLGTMQEGGYGVFLMRELMDEVEYRRIAPATIRVRLTKRWKGPAHG